MSAVRSPSGISRWRNRRRDFLLLFGLAYGLIGYSYIGQRIPNVQGTAQAVAAEILPLKFWGALWVFCALVMIGSAIAHWREPAGGDLGFGVGAAMPAWWGALAAFAWAAEASPRAWVTALVFWAMSGSVGVISGMVDPRFEVPPRE